MNYWKGKIAVVTGASAGIGAAILLDLAKAGVTVIGLARRKDRIEQLIKENTTYASFMHAFECDVSNTDSVVAAFKWIEEKFNKVHIIINNAGKIVNGSTLNSDIAHSDFANAINTNFTGLLVCTREAYRLMQKHNELGYIININSVLGHTTPTAQFTLKNVYGATKHAVTNLTETVRLDLANSGVTRIRVASLSPGSVKTEIAVAAGTPKEVVEEAYSKKPHLLPSDISQAIFYLLGLPENVNVTELKIKPVGEKS